MKLAWEQIDLTLAGLRRHYQAGDFTPRQLLACLRARGEHYRDRNIWIHPLTDAELEPYLQALEQSSPDTLPLYGVPFAIKDNINLASVPTTAACPAFTYTPSAHAAVVALLVQAGAIPVGKTNLDQLATGLVGTRSPWGECRNSFDPDYIAGGSSSGSAVAVALGLASFSLGTDTAGSGRVPAAFNNIVGLKPSRGLLSTRGVVPACRSLDCVSLFALTAADLETLFEITAQFDAEDPFARRNPSTNGGAAFGALPPATFRFGVPKAEQLEFFGDGAAAAAFETTVARLTAAGGCAVTIDFAPFIAAARLLYEGPWLAERWLVAAPLLAAQPDALLPVTRSIIAAGNERSAADSFAAHYELQRLRRIAETTLADVDFVLTPTAGTLFSQRQVAAEPIVRNSELGYYTNFMNLLDLSAVAVPAAQLPAGLPFGVTLFADRDSDARLLSHAHHLQTLTELPLGATGRAFAPATLAQRQELATVQVVVCGAHLSGLPLNGQLTGRGGRLLAATATAPCYRMYALPGAPARPGLVRDEREGRAIECELWELPAREFGPFVALIPGPLGIGKVQLRDGGWRPGFLCEHYALDSAQEISDWGGWRSYLAAR